MDSQDLNRRIIGLLTLAYNALPKLEQEEVDEDFAREFSKTVDSLMEGWRSSYAVNLDLPPDQSAEVQSALQGISHAVSSDLTGIFGMFTGIFVRLCQEVEDKYPDTDIPAMLQAIGLEAAAGE